MYLLAYLLTYRRIAATSSILVCAHLRRRPRRENTHNAGAEYIYICAYTRVSSPSVPKKETKANHHIERERRVSRFPRYAPFYFLFFNSLSLSLFPSRERANERANDARLRGAHVLSIVLPHGENFHRGGKKKMNALCSINPL